MTNWAVRVPYEHQNNPELRRLSGGRGVPIVEADRQRDVEEWARVKFCCEKVKVYSTRAAPADVEIRWVCDTGKRPHIQIRELDLK